MDEKPEAYRRGHVPFLGLKIYLDSRPLIPRPETEWWVEELAHSIFGASASDGERHEQISSSKLCVPKNAVREFRVLDLCAGSGAIGCAVLAECQNARVYFGEIDPAHEATIRKNLRENNLDESRAEIRIGDLFEPFGDTKFDVVAANPPYVPNDRELPKSVADYEPALALRAGSDGLAVIRRIASELPTYLAPKGTAWVECDSAHAEAACALFAEQGLQAEIRNDQYDRPRLIVIHW